MTLISATSQLAALIRTQIATQAWEAGQRAEVNGRRRVGTAKTATRPGHTANSSDSPNAPESLHEWVARRVHALSPDMPGRTEAAFRIFMESVLLQEFGRSIANSPHFDLLVTHVINQMKSDPELENMMQQTGNSLIGEDPFSST